MSEALTLTVSEFVAVMNQTLEYAYPAIIVTGELANFKVSKGRWVYFDLKDEEATVRFFGTVYQLPGPLEDGMLLAVQGMPRLHPQYGFSVNILNIRPLGKGAIKKAAALLQAKLEAEGLFDDARKRTMPYPPAHIALVTSIESAAYHDFVKVLTGRWGGVEITVIDVLVQGESAPAQLVAAIAQANELSEAPDVLVLTRGGGSADDLQAFNTEQVVRAVAASRIPTMVAIGHEVDISLAELAADRRGSTPSNAAELLVPDRRAAIGALEECRDQLERAARQAVKTSGANLSFIQRMLHDAAERTVAQAGHRLQAQVQLLAAYDPQAALQRGYALVRVAGEGIRSGRQLQVGNDVTVEVSDAQVTAAVKQVTMKTGTKHV